MPSYVSYMTALPLGIVTPHYSSRGWGDHLHARDLLRPWPSPTGGLYRPRPSLGQPGLEHRSLDLWPHELFAATYNLVHSKESLCDLFLLVP